MSGGNPPKSSSPFLPSPHCSDPPPLRPHQPCYISPPQSTWAGGPLCVPPKHNGTPRTHRQDDTHGEDIQGKAKHLFQRRRGGPCSGIAMSCRIKEASKIAALNYILADECHANNGCCKSYSSQHGWGPHFGVPIEAHVSRALMGGTQGCGQSNPGDSRDTREPVLAAVRQRKLCTPAAKVVSRAEAGVMFRC